MPQKNTVQTQIVEAMERWRAAFSSENPDNIVSLYSVDASLWGTLTSEQRTNSALIRDYFEKIFSFTDRNVTFHNSYIRHYGDVAISSGSYTFSLAKEVEKIVICSRFSFTYLNRDGRWLIAEHHSSAMPSSE